jgi:hypothetical protein
MEEVLTVAGRGGAGIREGPWAVERRRQVHGGAGDRRAHRHRTQCLLPRAGPLPRAGGAVAAGIQGCQRQTSTHLVDAVRRACRAVRAEGAGEAPRPGVRRQSV